MTGPDRSVDTGGRICSNLAVPVESTTNPTNGTSRCVPRLHLFVERMLVEGDSGDADQDWPVIALVFDYGGTQIRARDARDRFFVSAEAGVSAIERDRAAEMRLQCLLESFGAVEIDQVDRLVAPLDSTADYLVQLTDSVHAFCTFTAFAVPQLRALGCEVTIDPHYPYQVIEDDPAWRLSLEPELGRIDWFALEMGFEADGRKMDLLPALLAIIEDGGRGQSIEQWLRHSGKRQAIAIGPNRYITFPPERLRMLLQIVLELYRGDRTIDGRMRVGQHQAASLARLEHAAWAPARPGEIPTNAAGDQALLARGRRILGEASTVNDPQLLGLTVMLRPYQRIGLAWLDRLRDCDVAGLLADDMGLGKTLQTIALLGSELECGRCDLPSLVVCPTSLIENWCREFKTFYPSLECAPYHGGRRGDLGLLTERANVIVTTYSVLVRDLPQFSAARFHYIVLDEAQAIKNPRSQSAQAAKTLVARHRLCLSGTPIENNLDELWSLFDFLMPDLLGSKVSFQRRFRQPIERHGDAVRLAALRERVAPFVLRRMKEEVAKELPEKTELIRPVELEGDQRDLYESIRLAVHAQVRRAISKNGLTRSVVTILDALTKLRQVCCDPRLVRIPAAVSVERSAKRELFFELLSSQLQVGRRILVFSQFAKMLAVLSEGLLERGVRHMILTGQSTDRQRRVDAFQNGDMDVFLISLKAGGTGLNLTRADTVIHYDPWWNAAAQLQATDRAHRIGQTRPVFVHSLIVAGSVEERILALQKRKRWLADSIFGNDSNEKRPGLDPIEVERLFAPLG